jgi:hypothetical protein
MNNNLFAPGRKPIDEHATKAQPSLQEKKIRVPRICTVCRHDRRYLRRGHADSSGAVLAHCEMEGGGDKGRGVRSYWPDVPR